MALVGSLSGSFGLVGVSGTMEPAVNNAYSLGTSSKKWGTVFATALTGSLTKLADGTTDYITAGTNITVTTGSNGQITISSTAGGGGAPTTAQYLTLAADGTLSDERVFTAGTGISATDAGAGGNFTVAIDNSVVATLTGSAFSGGITGTTLSMTGNITGSNFLVSGDEITATAPVRINIGNTAATVNIGQSGTGNALNVRGNLDVDGTADIAGAITLSGNGQTVTHTGASGNLTIVSNNGNVVIESTTFNGNDVTIPGNLTVNGSVVSIASDNLKVKDSVLLLGSGSTTTNAKAAIAFVSGSSVANRAVIFGTVGGSDTSAVATMDVQDGTLPATNLDFTALAPMRASKFELGGSTAFITSSLGNNLNIQAATALTVQSTGNKIFLSPGAVGGTVEFQYSGIGLAEFTGSAGNAVFGAVSAKTMAISGSQVILNAGGPGIRFQRDSGLLGTVQGAASSNLSITAVDGTGTARSFILTGSDMILGANSVSGDTGGFVFRLGHNTDYARLTNTGTDTKFGAAPGKKLTLSGSQVFLNAGTGGSAGVLVQADGTNILTILSGTGPGNLTLGGGPSTTTADILNVDVTTVNFAGAATVLNLGATSGTTTVRNALVISGSTTLGDATGDDITFTGRAASSLLPKTDSTFDLGSPSFRWANIYTGDLHLRNDRGNWTIIEESEYLTITNNLNGKRYKFVLEEL